MTPRYDAAGDDVTPRYDALSPRSEVLARICIHTHTHNARTHARTHARTRTHAWYINIILCMRSLLQRSLFLAGLDLAVLSSACDFPQAYPLPHTIRTMRTQHFPPYRRPLCPGMWRRIWDVARAIGQARLLGEQMVTRRQSIVAPVTALRAWRAEVGGEKEISSGR